MTQPARFIPHTPNHAIEQVVFALTLDKPIDTDRLEKILEDERVRNSLSYKHIFRHLGMVTGIGSFPPGLEPVMFQGMPPQVVGLQLCDEMPMENAHRTLFVAAMQITLVRREYDRWQTTSSSVFEDIAIIMAQCKDRHITSAALIYIDRFAAAPQPDEGVPAAEMFRSETQFLPLSRAQDEKPWHNQCGFWQNNVLTNLNIQRHISPDNTPELTVETRCTTMFTEPLAIADSNLKDVYDPLHGVHHDIIRKLFSDKTLKLIGIDTSQGVAP